MQVLEAVAAVRRACHRAGLEHAGPARLGFVPTMGALHAGHLSLVRRAREECSVVAASIFVNPTQFAPGEDFDRYPRTLGADLAQLADAGVDLVFAPSVAEMYPGRASASPPAETVVDVAGLADKLDGASRPGHFRGVATVVAKLFSIVGPERAYFGQKDAAQVAVLRAMIRDLHLPVELVACPIVRDADGLALSSRNRYLSEAERAHALVLSRALFAMAGMVGSGIRGREAVLDAGQAVLRGQAGVALEYLALVDPDTLTDVPAALPGTLLAVAARVGQTRLIDNLLAE